MKVAQSCPTPCNLYSPWNSPGQNTGVGSRSLHQGIFPTQGSNPGLPHFRQILYQLNHKGSPKSLGRALILYGPSQVALVVKNPPANAEDTRNMGLIPGLGRSPGGGSGNPLQCSFLENPMDRGAWRLQSVGSQRVRHDWAHSAALLMYSRLILCFVS